MTSVTGTPPSFFPAGTEAAERVTLDGLEFARVVETVAAFAVGTAGAARIRARRPSGDAFWVAEELAAVRELRDVLRGGDPFHAEPLPSLAEILGALGIEGSTLDGAQLATAGAALHAMRVVRTELDRVRERAPRVARLAVELPPADVAKALERALEPDGHVKDGADKDVDRARRTVREARAQLMQTLDRILRGLAAHEAPAGASVTVRDGRYVIPISRDARGRVSGIVHGESGSGATLFVEPGPAVELGNAVQSAEAAEARAILALFRALTERLRPHREALARGIEMCIAADDLRARARHAVHVEGFVPRLDQGEELFDLRAVRHPLLLAEGVDAVPFDLRLDAAERCVIVSGPNTGGKTVLLKAIGLVSAMAQSGIVPPVGDGTVLPVFGRIVADIGDHQSIAESLSTFSAHLAELRVALDAAGKDTLVLLDEVGSGTDPVEGAALAGAALLSLTERGARTVATTHLGALKRLATEVDGVVNASLQFDADTLAPTYRLVKGVPGRSYGIVIARRLGLPADVLERAESRVPAGERELDAMLAEVETRARDVRRREEAAAELEAKLRSALEVAEIRAADLANRLDELKRREREVEREGREQARRFLLDARRRVEEALGVARAAVTEATAKEARRLVEQGISEEAERLKDIESAFAEKGWKVAGQKGRKGQSGTVAGWQEGQKRQEGQGSAHGARLTAPAAATELDLRGMTAEEAKSAVVQAVDAAVLADLAVFRIIHGKGTGVLRTVVGEVLAGDRRVAAHRLAPVGEGGSGVTIVELRA